MLVSQLIYSSFPRIGFTCLASAGVPTEVRQAFVERVVYQYWDSYNPPKAGYRAAYLHQLTVEDSLFGWLYNDGMDDLGRAHVPYFICYYLPGLLESSQLKAILACLQTGPIAPIDQQKTFPITLDTLVIPGSCSYQSVRTGVAIPSEVQEQSHWTLDQRTLLNLFVPVDKAEVNPPISNHTDKTLTSGQHDSGLNHERRQTMNTNKIEAILKELVSKPIGIQSAVLVSLEGQPMTAPIGMDESSVLIVAGTMLYLARSVHEELNWQEIESISVRAPEGHIILSACFQDIFLLVKAGKALAGLLEGEIKRSVKKVQDELNASEVNLINTTEIYELEEDSPPEFNPEAFPENNTNEIRYRGRRIG
ncbi:MULTISPECIES: roadblock/LC7 domain-containing protein [unclassified Coleofasciculus]|uniref:roadblock/LC7 domain-containing protein n=1 Tax=unclassified Coleofasciculus TaxID=2692782 RepID=UPI0018816703|nr:MULTISPECIES: dynein regulation protein LC7 [unclassified Coleofasciculus]MBE9130061.1 dynein regulation protein LC7 [Coleofasciculus sp. LEGE 07081]MBE9152406.1 dynein regulation protein LC7 [Coleofasciculus sp. LEGE 07092]